MLFELVDNDSLFESTRVVHDHTARIGGISDFVDTIPNLEIATIDGSFVNKEEPIQQLIFYSKIRENCRCKTHDNINFNPPNPHQQPLWSSRIYSASASYEIC